MLDLHLINLSLVSIIDVALEREVEGDLLLSDMGQDMGFMDGVINGAISISVVQVGILLTSYVKCALFLDHIYTLKLNCMVQNQYRHFLDHYIGVYPESNDQLELILGFAKRAGIAAGVVVDFSPRVAEGEFPLAAFYGG
ncbi:hypothetical protein C5167_032037 [Papaver somniferum]|uniref:Uncharacterized protein n=1 Tax=Papaver somniferum TaxID=3469 RepID=A0A4Y7KAB5_PAPSO|nr:hypothetical protein C5167_032037 [Papaver somniferum]